MTAVFYHLCFSMAMLVNTRIGKDFTKVLLRIWIFQFRRKQLQSFLSVKFVTFRTETEVMENIPNDSIVFWNIHFVHLYMKLRKSKEVHLNSLYFVGSTLKRLDLRTRPDRPLGPHSLLYLGSVLCVKRPGRAFDHPFHLVPSLPPSLPLCFQWHVTWWSLPLL